MNEHKKTPIERLLNLKTGKQELILGAKMRMIDEVPAVTVRVKEDIKLLIAPFLNNLLDSMSELIPFLDSEMLEEEKSNLSSEDGSYFGCIYYVFEEDGSLSIESRYNFISSEIHKTKKGKEFFNKLNALTKRILTHTTKLMDIYSVMKEEGELYSKRNFEFVYRKVNGLWEYHDFVPCTDRPFSEQKNEIQNLIELKIDTLLLDFVDAQNIDDIEQLTISFHSDGFNISDVRCNCNKRLDVINKTYTTERWTSKK